MSTTNKSISPRITDETISPKIEDTKVEKSTEQKPVQQELDPHVKTSTPHIWFAWMKKYGVKNFYVPRTSEKDKIPEYVSINGNVFWIDKGAFIDMPGNVAQDLAEKYNLELNPGTNVNGKNMRFDANPEKTTALS